LKFVPSERREGGVGGGGMRGCPKGKKSK